MQETVIHVQDFRKTYGNFVAVDGISFAVGRGEIFGLLGPNGAGKTSTLECLEGLRSPNGGSLSVAGVNPAAHSAKLRNLIDVQLQSSGLPESITPQEAMKFFCAYHGVAPRFDLLERVGIAEKRKTQFYNLSTGQQRRLSLALAVAHNPAVLFLDEPTAGLDVASRVDLHNLMRELQAAGTTIILATHDMAEAEEMSDRVAILLKGKIVSVGTPLEITAAGAGLTRISARTQNGSLAAPDLSFPAVNQYLFKDEYHIYYSTDIGPTVSAIIGHIQVQGDSLIDLRVERRTPLPEGGAVRVLDLNLRQNYHSPDLVRGLLEDSTILKLNDEELRDVGEMFTLPGSETEILRSLLRTFPLVMIALTKGRKGSRLIGRDQDVHHPGYPVEAVDTVGAGDAFTAALAVGYLKRMSWEDISEAANRLASQVCTRPGAWPDPPSKTAARTEA